MELIIHQIFLACAIGLNMSRDAAKTGEYQMLLFNKLVRCPYMVRKSLLSVIRT